MRRECLFKEKGSFSTQAKGSQIEAFQAPSGKMFHRERTFLDPLKSHHPGSHHWAEKRLSLTRSHTPMLALLLPTAPLPRARGHCQNLLPSQMRLHKYLHSSSQGLQQTPHRGAARPTLSRPQRRPGVAHTLGHGRPARPPGWGWDRKPPCRPGHPAPAQLPSLEPRSESEAGLGRSP